MAYTQDESAPRRAEARIRSSMMYQVRLRIEGLLPNLQAMQSGEHRV